MEKEIRICPKCGSINLGTEGFNYEPHDYCKDCGFQGRNDVMAKNKLFIRNFPKVKISELKKIQEEFKKEDKPSN